MIVGIFLINSCNKDKELSDSEFLEYRSDTSNLSTLGHEFYDWFYQELPAHRFEDPYCQYIPFTFEIDWDSGTQLDMYGSNSLAFNVINNPVDTILFTRNQVLFIKNGSTIEIKTLSYFAYDKFYTDLAIIPSLNNFTGYLLESSGGPKLIDKVYCVIGGGLFEIYIPSINTNLLSNIKNKNDLKIGRQKELQLNLRDNDPCPGAEGGGHIGRGLWWLNLKSGIADWWNSGPTPTEYEWDWYTPGEYPYIPPTYGRVKGAGGSGSGIDPWNNPDFCKNSACIDRNWILLFNLMPEIFSENYLADFCNIGQTNEDNIRFVLAMFCSSNKNSCNLSNEEDLNAFKSFLAEKRNKRALYFLKNCVECQENFDDIEDKYCFNLPTEIQVAALLGSQDCSNIYNIEMISLAYYVNSLSFYEDLGCSDKPKPCWTQVLGEQRNEAKRFDAWCAKFKGFSFEYFQSRGWTGPIDSQGLFPDDEWRYVIDPTNENYVIDMRHFLFVGFHLQQITGVGNFAGDVIEIGQFLKGNQSGLNWQDFFSNRLGVAFYKWMIKQDLKSEINSSTFAQLICEFLDSPEALNMRPFPNPQDCK